MAVYDDMRGWDTLPYLAQEFYLEYGDFDYAVTVPADMLVAGSGELVNPKEVLHRDRARAARPGADQRRDGDDPRARRGGRPGQPAAAGRHARPGTSTWTDTRDVAFTASAAFVWDAARINLPGGKTSLAQSVYPPRARATTAGAARPNI